MQKEKLRNGTEIKNGEVTFIYTSGEVKHKELRTYLTDYCRLEQIAKMNFEILEEQIDIQVIEELEIDVLKDKKYNTADIYMIAEQLNILLRAIKQLDKKGE